MVIEDAGDGAWQSFACRLVERAYLDDRRVLVHCGSPGLAASFDEALWRFSDCSFVPHEVAGPGTDSRSPVVLWPGEGAPPEGADVLVNLDAAVPGWFRQFARIDEVLDGDAARRRAGRDRFRFYRSQGIEPVTCEGAP